jgi:Protein of unknown function (DUF1360)
MIQPLDFIILALAAYRITHFFIEDYLFNTPREAIFRRFPPETHKLGYLFTCPWCFGFYVSIFMVVCYLIVPIPTLVGASILAISAIVGLLDAWRTK